jgi:hypothetical protein
MRKFLFGLLAAAAIVSPAYAEDRIVYKSTVDSLWSIEGVSNLSACFVIKRMDDGSYFALVMPYPLNKTNMPYMMVNRKEWKIEAHPGVMDELAVVAFLNRNGDVTGSTEMQVEVIDGNTVSFEGLTGDFLVDFGKSSKIGFILKIDGMTTDNNAFTLPLNGSEKALMKALDCLEKVKEELE